MNRYLIAVLSRLDSSCCCKIAAASVWIALGTDERRETPLDQHNSTTQEHNTRAQQHNTTAQQKSTRAQHKSTTQEHNTRAQQKSTTAQVVLHNNRFGECVNRPRFKTKLGFGSLVFWAFRIVMMSNIQRSTVQHTGSSKVQDHWVALRCFSA